MARGSVARDTTYDKLPDPRRAKRLTAAQKARVEELAAKGHVPRDIAFSLGISYSQAQAICRKFKK